MIVGKQAHGGVLRLVLVEYRKTLLPCFFLFVVDLPQVQDCSLGCPTRRQPPILHNTEVAMDFAVFLPFRASKKHSLAQCQNLSG